jgi:hypothetical protein
MRDTAHSISGIQSSARNQPGHKQRGKNAVTNVPHRDRAFDGHTLAIELGKAHGPTCSFAKELGGLRDVVPVDYFAASSIKIVR